MNLRLALQILIIAFIFNSCASKKYSDINYLKTDKSQDAPTLNVFSPRKKSESKRPVYLFVHGGNWNSGKKEMYGFIGRNMAKHGAVTVIPGYTLSPEANYDKMAQQIAEAIKWTRENIDKYNGDPEQIYVSGHSAGGHLVALVATNPKYLEDNGIIAGIILNDAAGLDRLNYFNKKPPTEENDYITTWTQDPENWKDASPIYFIDERTPPIKIYLGSKTYASIKEGNARFTEKLKNYQPELEITVLDKKHVPMVTQFIWPWNKRYDEIAEFMRQSMQ